MITDEDRKRGLIDCMKKWAAECEDSKRRWIEKHANDPCTRCGGDVDREAISVGSLARLEMVCAACRTAMRRETEAYWRGHGDGVASVKILPWWKRLFL